MTIIYYLLIILLMLFMVIGLYQASKIFWAPDFDLKKMKLNHEILGSGSQKVLLLHGMAGTLDYWKRGNVERDKTHSYFAVDLLGFGESPKPKSSYNYYEHISSIEKIVVKEKLNDGSTLVLGHSMGALLALALVSRNPEWYKGLTLMSIPLFSNRDEIIEFHRNGSLFDKLSVGEYGIYFCMLHPIYFTEVFRPKDLPKDVFQNASKHTWFSYDRSFKNIILDSDITEYADKLKDKKIFFIHGDRDTTAPYSKALKFSQSFSNSRILTIKNGDHQIYLTNHKQIWEAFTTYFDG
ncbi:MAG: alpha/beta hydrolase [Balneola sp.]